MELVRVSLVTHDLSGGTEQELEALFIPVLEEVARREGLRFHVSIMTVDADVIQDLNRRYRGVDSVTDVLSFPAADFTGKLKAHIAAGGAAEYVDDMLDLGDIALCIPRATEQAQELGQSAAHELKFLVLHGTLHLIGYDHMTPEQEEEMTSVQRSILPPQIGTADEA